AFLRVAARLDRGVELVRPSRHRRQRKVQSITRDSRTPLKNTLRPARLVINCRRQTRPRSEAFLTLPTFLITVLVFAAIGSSSSKAFSQSSAPTVTQRPQPVMTNVGNFGIPGARNSSRLNFRTTSTRM